MQFFTTEEREKIHLMAIYGSFMNENEILHTIGEVELSNFQDFVVTYHISLHDLR